MAAVPGRFLLLLSPQRTTWFAVRDDLEAIPGVRVHAFTHLPEYIAVFGGLAPDAVVLGVEPGGGLLEPSVQAVLAAYPGTTLAVISEERTLPEFVRLVALGVRGFLTTSECARETLVRDLQAVLDRRLVVTPALVDGWSAARSQRRAQRDHRREPVLLPEIEWLKARQKDVLRAIQAGLSQPEIARRLGIGLRTVVRVEEELRAALGLESNNQLYVYAAAHPLSEGQQSSQGPTDTGLAPRRSG